jgi:diaminopropionate ammonia-lyase
MSHLEDDVLWNPAWVPPTDPTGPPGPEIAAFHRSMPGFRRSPLIEVPQLAEQAGVAHVFVKHEADRLGLPSFKVMGASWAVNVALAREFGVPPFGTFEELRAACRVRLDIELLTATDGNHGRAVAFLARVLGLRSRILVPYDMVPERIRAIEGEGAEVVVVDGTYDDAVRRAAELDGGRTIVVSDTSWPGYSLIPRAVVDGYSTIFVEAREQVDAVLGAAGSPIDVAVVPVGVGSFASAAAADLHQASCHIVTAEPTAADCLWQSLAAAAPVVVPGPHRSSMAGLNCGEVSADAWPILQRAVRAAVRVSDREAHAAVRDLAPYGIDCSESGAASLAGLRRLRLDTRSGSLLRPGATVVLFNTEGVTAPPETGVTDDEH